MERFQCVSTVVFSLVAPSFSNPLRDAHIDPTSCAVFFSCQLAGTPRLPVPELLYQRKNKEVVDGFGGVEDLAYGVGNVAAAWYLGGVLLSDGPGVMLGASSGGWLWLRLDDASRVQAGKVVECIVRARNGKAKTQARILLPGKLLNHSKFLVSFCA